MDEGKYKTRDYIKRRKKLSGAFFETALPNEYLVEVGRKDVKPILGGSRLRLFKKYMRIPASVQTLYFTTDNANLDYQGIGIEGYASWRIDPAQPEIAIRTLDFFDDDDPMARTNEELKTICIEAVRHVISNMTIDHALKKKDEIAENLKTQLREVEKKWGIIFDQVGIEKVRIMSPKLFEQLQAQFRDGLRLEVERKRINTDREIARENNSTREKTELETLETDKKLNLVQVENQSRVQETSLTEKYRLSQKQREIDEQTFRDEIQFKSEKEKRQHELEILEKTLQLKLLETEKSLLEKHRDLEILKTEIGEQQVALERLRREVSQTFTSESLAKEFIEKLPEIYQSLQIQNYTVLSSGGEEISPVSKLLLELSTVLKGTDWSGLFGGKKKEE